MGTCSGPLPAPPGGGTSRGGSRLGLPEVNSRLYAPQEWLVTLGGMLGSFSPHPAGGVCRGGLRLGNLGANSIGYNPNLCFRIFREIAGSHR